jgi:aspartate aminotransferase-like enzyme
MNFKGGILMHKKLFIPGPIETRKEVLEKMATPMIGHRTKEASALQRGISDKLRSFSIRRAKYSCPLPPKRPDGRRRTLRHKKRGAFFLVGSFGKRWYEMAVANNVPADIYEVADDSIRIRRWSTKRLKRQVRLRDRHAQRNVLGLTNPCGEIGEVIKNIPTFCIAFDAVSSAGGMKIEVDKWGIDVCVTSSQKALGLPPGLSVCTFSEKAVERAKEVTNRGYYLDLLQLYNTVKKKDYQYPSTPSLSHMFALDYQLDCIMEEGLDNRFARHKEMADYVRAWAKEHFALSRKKLTFRYATCVKNTREIDVAALRKELNARGLEISNGYGDLKGLTFASRIWRTFRCPI